MNCDYEFSFGTSIKYITRKVSIKWWEKFAYDSIMEEFSVDDQNQFFIQKSLNQANIASSSSKKE